MNATELTIKTLKDQTARADLWQIRAFALATELRAMGRGDLAETILKSDKRAIYARLNGEPQQ